MAPSAVPAKILPAVLFSTPLKHLRPPQPVQPQKRPDLSRRLAMVEALCPARFYGGSLPRPRFLSDDARVDPLPPVMDPLLAWAADAHWSMGGLSFDRKRLVGKIDGRVERIRAHKEQVEKKAAKGGKYALVDESEEDGDASPPPVRVTRKRTARGGEDGVAEIEARGESGRGAKRRLVRKADVGGGPSRHRLRHLLRRLRGVVRERRRLRAPKMVLKRTVRRNRPEAAS